MKLCALSKCIIWVVLGMLQFCSISTHALDLMYSRFPDRTAPEILNGAVVAGEIYVFTAPDADIRTVDFFLNDPNMAGAPFQQERYAPFDFAGTAPDNLAFPWTVPNNNPHTITAAVTLLNGDSQIRNAHFNQTQSLVFSKDRLFINFIQSGDSDSAFLDLTASGLVETDFTLSVPDVGWIYATPVTGTTPALIMINVDSSGLEDGVYEATVQAEAPYFEAAVVAVRMAVGPTVEFSKTASIVNEAVTQASIPVSLPDPLQNDVTVDYAVTGGTAAPGSDFVLPDGTLTIKAGETQANIIVALSDDSLNEENETIEVTLSNSSGASIGEYFTHTFTIADDDSASSTVIRVDKNVTNPGNGSTWTTAYRDLQLAFANAPEGCEIWIAAGTYTSIGSGETAFIPPAGVALYGGFSGSESSRDQRDPALHQTILEHNEEYGSEPPFPNNLLSVNQNLLLDGLTLDGEGDLNLLRCDNGSVNVSNCYFTGTNVLGSVIVDSVAKFDNCIFITGSGCRDYNSVSAYKGCVFKCDRFLGTVVLNENTQSTYVNCVFPKSSFYSGEVVSSSQSLSSFLNCTFSIAYNEVEHVYFLEHNESDAAFINCIIYGELHINNEGASQPIFQNSLVSGSGDSGAGWNSQFGIDGGGNIDQLPLFLGGDVIDEIDEDGPDNNFGTTDDGLQLKAESPCIDAADSSFAPAIDILGQPRPLGASADMGAYEFQSSSGTNLFYSALPNRASPQQLDGAQVEGFIYVFTYPDDDVKSVTFRLDGSFHRTENIAPFDFNGTDYNGLAYPWTVPETGSHTISALITFNDGSNELIEATFNRSRSLQLDPDSLQFDFAQQGPSDQAMIYLDTSDGSSTIFSLSVSNDGWIEVDSNPAMTPAYLTITVHSQELSYGVHEALIEVSATGYESAQAPVRVTVGPTAEFQHSTSVVNEAVTLVSIPVVLTAPLQNDVTVDYGVTGGSASANTDFILPSGTLNFQTGETQKNIVFELIDDDEIEDDETIVVELTNPVGFALGSSVSHTFVIADNDDPAQNEIVYVDTNASGSNNGTSWTDAYTDLRNAFENAPEGCEIRIAAGNYRPDEFDSTISFEPPNGVAIYGGYHFDDALQYEQRDTQVYKSELNGADFTSHVVVPGNNILFDGLAITKGYAQASDLEPAMGAGVLAENVALVFNDCQIVENFAAYDMTFDPAPAEGAGIHVRNCALAVKQTLFHQNAANNGDGGGLYAEQCLLFIDDSQFIDTAEGFSYWIGQGAFVARASEIYLTNCSFSENFSGTGAAATFYSSFIDIRDCNFQYNYSEYGDGAVNIYDGDAYIESSTFADNFAYISAGAVAASGSSEINAVNCTFSGNSVESYPGSSSRGSALSLKEGTHRFERCMFLNNRSYMTGLNYDAVGVVYNEQATSEFSNCLFAENKTAVAWENPPVFPQESSAALCSNVSGNVSLINCTVARNSEESDYDGVLFKNGPAGVLTLVNLIIWGNFHQDFYWPPFDNPNPKLPIRAVANMGTTVISASDIEGSGGSGSSWNSDYGIDGGGNIDADPLFVNADDPLNDGLQLTAGSPCIDTGTINDAPPTDILGQPRPSGAGVDMGAYELQSSTGVNLFLSFQKNRSAPQPLHGAVVQEDIYVFTAPDDTVERVAFDLDGVPYRSERYAPYDFAGTDPEDNAYPFDTRTLSDGPHSITAHFTMSDGSNHTVTANFTVANHAPSLSAQPPELSFTLEQDQNDQAAVQITASDSGSPSLNVTDSGESWLSSTVSGATVTVYVDSAGLNAGTYTGSVQVNATGYAGVTVPVRLQVLGDENGLVAHWRFDEASGSIAYDSSGNGHDGTISGAQRVPGQSVGALQFDGSNDYVNIANSAPLNPTGAVTLSAWIRVANPNLNRFMRIIAKKTDWDTASGYEMQYNPGENYLSVMAGGSSVGRAYNVALDSNWHHVAAVVSNGTATLYADGRNVTTSSAVGPLLANSNPLRIGSQLNGTNWFYGDIDEVAIYNRALSAADIATLAGGGIAVSEEVALFEFSDNTEDSSSAATADSANSEQEVVSYSVSNWLLPFYVNDNEVPSVMIGIDELATNGFDEEFDTVAPLQEYQELDSVLLDIENLTELISDVRAPGDEPQVWILQIINPNNATGLLRWQPQDLPDSIQPVLTELDENGEPITGSSVNLQEINDLTLTGKSLQTFEIRTGYR